MAGVVASLIVVIGLTLDSAPQQAAAFALACALVIIPYVFTRAAEAVAYPNAQDALSTLVKAIKHGTQATPDQPSRESEPHHPESRNTDITA